MADFYLKKGDRQPPLNIQLLDSAGSGIDITGASVAFKMRLESSTTLKVDSAATVVTASTGVVRYSWGASDTDTAGKYLAEFLVTYGDATTQRVPNDGYISIEIINVLP